MLKRTAFIGLCLCLIICAGGCNQQDTPSESDVSAQSSSQLSELSSPEAPPPEGSDTFYPIGPNTAYERYILGKQASYKISAGVIPPVIEHLPRYIRQSGAARRQT